MNVEVKQRKLKSGKISLFLDITGNGERNRVSLGMFIYDNPKTPSQKMHNRNQLELADRLRVQKEYELQNSFNGFEKSNATTSFIEFIKYFIEHYEKKDKRVFAAVQEDFIEFLSAKNIRNLSGKAVSILLLEDFGAYLKTKHNYSTPQTYFKRFRTILRRAKKERVISIELDELKVSFNNDKSAIRKSILTQEEILALYAAPSSQPIITRAFTFCLNTGLDYATVSQLTWQEIDGDYIRFDRTKTNRRNNNVLNEMALEALGKRGNDEELIFPLPSHAQCVKTINVWAQRAGIKKHITWHSARHSLGSILVNDDNVNIRAVQEVMGHSNIQTTQRYTQIKSAVKDTALRNLKIGRKPN